MPGHSPGTSRRTHSQPAFLLSGLQYLAVVPNIPFSHAHHFQVPPDPSLSHSCHLGLCRPVCPHMIRITDLVTVHAVAMPQGKDLPEGDGDGEAHHSDGKGVSHKLCKQLCLGWHWGYQPGRDIGEVGEPLWLWLPHLPEGTSAYPVVMLPTTSIWNLSFRFAPNEIPVAPMSCGDRTELGEGGPASTIRGKGKPLWGTEIFF